MAALVVLRTGFFDRAVEQRLDVVQPVMILGAGFDRSTARYRGTPDHRGRGQTSDGRDLSGDQATIKTKQRARVDATIAKPTTTLRRARLLRAGVPQRSSTDASAEDGR